MYGEEKPAQGKATARPKAFEISEEMKQWSALLSQELSSWPQVERRRMFGMASFYRKGIIFAAVPEKKAFFSPSAVIFKLQTPTVRQQECLAHDPQISASFGVRQKWYRYELGSDSDIHGALEWFDKAFQAAGPAKSPTRKRTA